LDALAVRQVDAQRNRRQGRVLLADVLNDQRAQLFKRERHGTRPLDGKEIGQPQAMDNCPWLAARASYRCRQKGGSSPGVPSSMVDAAGNCPRRANAAAAILLTLNSTSAADTGSVHSASRQMSARLSAAASRGQGRSASRGAAD
jgi:hypothetical protein